MNGIWNQPWSKDYTFVEWGQDWTAIDLSNDQRGCFRNKLSEIKIIRHHQNQRKLNKHFIKFQGIDNIQNEKERAHCQMPINRIAQRMVTCTALYYLLTCRWCTGGAA